MPAFNYKKVFAAKVADGSKPHTIRADRRDGQVWNVGDSVKHYTGMRTQHCRLIGRSPLVRVDRIRIYTLTDGVCVNGAFQCDDEIVQLAKRDGFDDVSHFFAFFHASPKTMANVFEGQLYWWDVYFLLGWRCCAAEHRVPNIWQPKAA